jgi:hypothetical protein
MAGVYEGNFSCFRVPPVLIYPRNGLKESLLFGTPSGSVFYCQEKCWVNIDVYWE